MAKKGLPTYALRKARLHSSTGENSTTYRAWLLCQPIDDISFDIAGSTGFVLLPLAGKKHHRPSPF